jgi:hypothetical protein
MAYTVLRLGERMNRISVPARTGGSIAGWSRVEASVAEKESRNKTALLACKPAGGGTQKRDRNWTENNNILTKV